MSNVNRLRAGLLAPGFILKDLEGRKLALSDFGGERNLLLSFCRTLKNPLCLKRLQEPNRSYDLILRKDT
jgi:peroxiredoxin